MLIFVLVLALFPSAPGHMQRPIRHAAASYDTLDECIAAGQKLHKKVAGRTEVQYTMVACVPVTLTRGSKEDT